MLRGVRSFRRVAVGMVAAAAALLSLVAVVMTSGILENDNPSDDAVPPVAADPLPPGGVSSIHLTVAVFPGDVLGRDAHDRLHRLRAANETWVEEGYASSGGRMRVVFIKDYAKPFRDEGLLESDFLQLPAARTTTALDVLQSLCEWFIDDRRAAGTSSSSTSTGDKTSRGGTGEEEAQHYLLLMHDHTYLLPRNLLCLLRQLQRDASSFPYFIGSKLTIRQGEERSAFVSLPAGTLLSDAAVRLWIRQYTSGKCDPPQPWYRNAPSHLLAECLFDSGVRINTGADADDAAIVSKLALGFSVYGPVREMNRAYDEWYIKYKLAATAAAVPCCSTIPVTYHYTEHTEVRFLHKVLYDRSGKYRSRNAAAATEGSKTRRERVFADWPSRDEPYSQRPTSADDPAVSFLANVAQVAGCRALR